ncbi:MAG TPA: OsmC family protein [Gemmatimonadales bacterium]|nr:OsmC family protein [Gemmatimonadales bacterium]
MTTGNVREVAVQWAGGLRFDGRAEGRPAVRVDGDGREALSPVELLLVAAGACTGADVVGILEKQRVTLRALEITVTGTRREEHPRRYTALHLRFAIRGEGADQTKARRAIDLSLEKYCSVVATLAPDLRVTYDVALA